MLTNFQKLALASIARVGSIEYRETTDKRTNKLNKEWVDHTGDKVQVLNEDRKTFGVVGWPTITALMRNKKLIYNAEKNKYVLTKQTTESNDA